VVVAIPMVEAVKVDRQDMEALLMVEKQTYLLLILVVLLQVEKGSCLAQVVFK
jgi:hypothetical protein